MKGVDMNLSGLWEADLLRSEFGSLPKPVSLVRDIREDGPALLVSVKSVNEQDLASRELKIEELFHRSGLELSEAPA